MSETRTVLLVEDDPELRDTIELLLLRQGYHVVSTGNGLRAVQLAEQHDIGVALVDLLIPGQSGFQVTLDLKARFGNDITVVIMTGAVSSAYRDYAFAAGADCFLPKPFTVSQLTDAVAAICPLPNDSPSVIPRRTARIGL